MYASGGTERRVVRFGWLGESWQVFSAQAGAWILGAFVYGVVTLIVIYPINRRLLAPDRDPSAGETRELLIKWGQLHAIRSVLAFVAGSIYIWQLAGQT